MSRQLHRQLRLHPGAPLPGRRDEELEYGLRMHCYVSRRVSDSELSIWLEQRFPSHRFAINRNPTSDEVWVESRFHQDGGFPWKVDVYLRSAPIEVELGHVSALARALRCNALAPDERPIPTSFVLLTPEGDRLWVDLDSSALDERDALIIAGPATHDEGRLSSETPLEQVALTRALSRLLGVEDSQVRVQEWVGPQEPPPSPFDAWHPIVEGVHYRFTYAVSVVRERRPWRSLADESAHWERLVSQLSARYGQPFCAHAEYLEQVAHIPGGSDSECRCIWVDGASRREVVTKRRRASW